MTLDEQIKVLVSRLENYGQHLGWCAYHQSSNPFICDCGLSGAVKEAGSMRDEANKRSAIKHKLESEDGPARVIPVNVLRLLEIERVMLDHLDGCAKITGHYAHENDCTCGLYERHMAIREIDKAHHAMTGE